jgi:hypothetical protein
VIKGAEKWVSKVEGRQMAFDPIEIEFKYKKEKKADKTGIYSIKSFLI